METSITSEKRKEYILLRDNFHKKRDGVKSTIESHELIINKQKREISKLEEELKDSRPLIEGCDNHMMCKDCDIYSMKYLGASPNPDKYHFYECVLCGFEDNHT